MKIIVAGFHNYLNFPAKFSMSLRYNTNNKVIPPARGLPEFYPVPEIGFSPQFFL